MSDALEGVLEAEGWPAFTDDPHDRGGPTKGGITLRTLAAWRGRPVSVEELQELELEEAIAIYRNRYVEAPRFDWIADDLLREQLVDVGVLSGPRRAIRWLQEELGVEVDGMIGRVTLGALEQRDAHELGQLLAARRQEFFGEIVSSNYRARRRGETSRDQARFAHGWARRGAKFQRMEAAAGPRKG